MAQKTNPISTRFVSTTLWKHIWGAPSMQQSDWLVKTRASVFFLKKFYKKQGFDLLNIRLETAGKTGLFFMSIRKILPEKINRLRKLTKFYSKNPRSLNIYPRLARTLPRAIPLKKLRLIGNNWLYLNLYNNTSNSTTVDKKKLIRQYNFYEFSILLAKLHTIFGNSILLVKSHPSSVLDCMPTAEYLAIYVRQQLLYSVKKKKKVIPLRYFRYITNYLMLRFSGYLRGIRLKIKGRLPKLGGSAGAARSKKQLLSLGYLSTQRLLAPIDFDYVDLGSRSGICSLSVWVSYHSPLCDIN